MVRRYKAIEDSEMNSRKECIKLREEVVNIENAVTEKIGELQRFDCYLIVLISFLYLSIDWLVTKNIKNY